MGVFFAKRLLPDCQGPLIERFRIRILPLFAADVRQVVLTGSRTGMGRTEGLFRHFQGSLRHFLRVRVLALTVELHNLAAELLPERLLTEGGHGQAQAECHDEHYSHSRHLVSPCRARSLMALLLMMAFL